MKLAAYMTVSFITFLHILLVSFIITVYMVDILYASVYFRKLCILIMFMHFYCYVCSVLGILFYCAVLCVILYYDQQMYIYRTNYHVLTLSCHPVLCTVCV